MKKGICWTQRLSDSLQWKRPPFQSQLHRCFDIPLSHCTTLIFICQSPSPSVVAYHWPLPSARWLRLQSFDLAFPRTAFSFLLAYALPALHLLPTHTALTSVPPFPADHHLSSLFFSTADIAYPSLHGSTTFPSKCELSHLSPIAFRSFPSVPSHALRSTPSFVVLPAAFDFLSFLSTEEIHPQKWKTYNLKECHDLSTLGNACRLSPSLFRLIVQVLVTAGRQASHWSVAEVHLIIYLKARSEYGMTIRHDWIPGFPSSCDKWTGHVYMDSIWTSYRSIIK